MIGLAKANYFRDLLVKCQGNASKLWKYMNNFTRPRQTTRPRSLMINNKNITDKLSMANHLNQLVASVATRLVAHMNSSNEDTSYNNNILRNDKFNGVPDTSSYSCVFGKRYYRVLVRVSVCVCVSVFVCVCVFAR